MAHVVAPNLRGKGISTTKFTKSGDPKRSGNWSASTVHRQSLQYKDYDVMYKEDEDGIKHLVIGDHTRLADIMGDGVAALAMFDKHFDTYVQSGKYEGLGNGKGYEARRTLRKRQNFREWYPGEAPTFRYREEIYTDGDFTYNFPEY